MATLLAPTRPTLSFHCARLIARTSPSTLRRALSTLPNNPHIYIHPLPSTTPTKSHLLSLLPTTPALPSLALGTTPTLPPTPDSLTENPNFLRILHAVIKAHAPQDPDVLAQAAMYASQAGSALGSGGAFFPQQRQQRGKRDVWGKKATGGGGGSGGDGAGGASAQGGMGGAGRGGYIHVADQRNPPDFGRVAWPEDIFGSLELDGKGEFVGDEEAGGVGRYQEAGTYRMVTHEGILGLSPFLRVKLVERLREMDGLARGGV
ncbi:hypothetical protein LTR08_000749 [Meristemomyces frigidus]|nr:hypothetical protein LTR08_000749 [Meristemomyces frigidus]